MYEYKERRGKKGGGGSERENAFMFPYLLVFEKPDNPVRWAGKNNFIQFRNKRTRAH